MGKWRIHPEGVGTVLSGVGTVAATLSEDIEALPAPVEEAVVATGNSPVIADALYGFFEHISPTLESIGNRIQNGINGAGRATEAYDEGHTDIAEEIQAAAAAAGGDTLWQPEGQ